MSFFEGTLPTEAPFWRASGDTPDGAKSTSPPAVYSLEEARALLARLRETEPQYEWSLYRFQPSTVISREEETP